MASATLVPTPTNTIEAVAGMTLFNIAAQYLGDATKWNQISDLNPSLNGDPLIQARVTLVMPTSAIASNGGLIAR